MAKAKFNRDEVVKSSLDLFWQQGYTASSMQQICEITGLKPGSIYHAFGNKKGLFKEAIDYYSASSAARSQEILNSAPCIGEGLCDLLESIIVSSTDSDYCSCFLIKTQLELASGSLDLHQHAMQKLEETELMYQDYIVKEFGQQGSSSKATSLMLHIFGVRVYGYQTASVERMRAGLRAGLPWLPWPHLH